MTGVQTCALPIFRSCVISQLVSAAEFNRDSRAELGPLNLVQSFEDINSSHAIGPGVIVMEETP